MDLHGWEIKKVENYVTDNLKGVCEGVEEVPEVCMDSAILSTVRKVISYTMGLREDDLTFNSTCESLDMDSLDIIEVVMGLEDAFDIKIDEEAYDCSFYNLKDVVLLVQKLIADQN